MGNAASVKIIDSEKFKQLTDFYESKKNENLIEAELFNQFKAFYDKLVTVYPPQSPRFDEIPAIVTTDLHPGESSLPPVDLTH